MLGAAVSRRGGPRGRRLPVEGSPTGTRGGGGQKGGRCAISFHARPPRDPTFPGCNCRSAVIVVRPRQIGVGRGCEPQGRATRAAPTGQRLVHRHQRGLRGEMSAGRQTPASRGARQNLRLETIWAVCSLTYGYPLDPYTPWAAQRRSRGGLTPAQQKYSGDLQKHLFVGPRTAARSGAHMCLGLPLAKGVALAGHCGGTGCSKGARGGPT